MFYFLTRDLFYYASLSEVVDKTFFEIPTSVISFYNIIIQKENIYTRLR